LLKRYGAAAQSMGYVWVEEGVDRGQPFARYKKGSQIFQIKVGHGRGNYTVKLGFHTPLPRLTTPKQSRASPDLGCILVPQRPTRHDACVIYSLNK
jgi:hypothetical protein